MADHRPPARFARKFRTKFAWREEALREETYNDQMAKTYSGAGLVELWRQEDEERIRQWLAVQSVSVPKIG